MSEPIPEPVNPSISITTLSLGNGTVAAPSLAFTSDTDTGLYSEAANMLAISSGGVKSFNSSATQLGLYKPLNFSAVAAATGDSTNMYAYRKTATNKIFTNSGTEIELTNQNSQYKLACGVVSTANVTLVGGAPKIVDSVVIDVGSRVLVNGQTAAAENGIYVVTVKGSGSNGTWVRSSDLSTADAIYLNTMCFVTEGTVYANTFWKITTAPAALGTDPLAWTQISLAGGSSFPLLAPAGSASAPSYSFTGDENTGIYSSAANTINFTTDGTLRAGISDNSFTSTVGIHAPSINTDTGDAVFIGGQIIGSSNGNAAAPTYTFFNTNTGIYSSAADTLNFAANGIERFQINENNISSTLPLFMPVGSVSAPSYSFTGDTGTGMYSSEAKTLNFAANGIERFQINENTISSATPLFVPAGNASAPSYSFTGDTNTGIYSSAADTLNFTTSGTERFQINENTISSTLPLFVPVGSASAPSYSFDGDTNTGIYSSSSSQINFTTSGTERFQINENTISSTLPLFVPVGSASAPSYSFDGDTNTGIYSSAADTLNFATNGTERFQINENTISSTLPLFVPAGSDSAPSYSFTGDTDTGLYSSAANTINFATNGTERFRINENNISSTLQIRAPSIYIDTGDATFLGGQIIGVPFGNAAAPTYTFFFNTATGMYSSAANTLNFAANGIERFQINGNTVSSTLPLLVPVGSASAPSYSFTGDTNTGLYRSNASELSITNAGVRTATFSADHSSTFTGGAYFSTAVGQSSVTYYKNVSANLTVSGAYSTTWSTRFARIGRIITITFPNDYSSRATAAAALTTTAVDADFRPTEAIRGIIVGYNNGALTNLCYNLGTNGVITVGNSATNSSAAFTAVTAITGPYGWTISFTLGG